jgi:hypothetical protein
MNDTDVLGLLIYANELDGRISPNEVKVRAWADVINEHAPDMPVTFAQDVARKHYGKLDAMITPSVFVKAWHDRLFIRNASAIDRMDVDRHCGTPHCGCNHHVCYRGWIDGEDSHRTQPCGTCRSDLFEMLLKMPPPGMRNSSDQAALQGRSKA